MVLNPAPFPLISMQQVLLDNGAYLEEADSEGQRAIHKVGFGCQAPA